MSQNAGLGASGVVTPLHSPPDHVLTRPWAKPFRPIRQPGLAAGVVKGHGDERGFRSSSCIGYIVCYTYIMPSEMRYPDVKKMLEAKGYLFTRISGAHHVFTKPGARPFAVPVHHGKVKPVYVRQIQKLQG